MRKTPSVERAMLRSFSPLNSLKAEHLRVVEEKAAVMTYRQGETIFRQGDRGTSSYYLIGGVVELLHEDRSIGIVRSSTQDARFPLGGSGIQRHGARVSSTRAECLVIESELLDVLLTWDQTGAYYVGDLQSICLDGVEDDDWMVRLLQSQVFKQIPPANIQSMFMRMERIDFRAGEVVVRQGAEGDYFYVIVRGRCVVTRKMPLRGADLQLAELGVGDTFGEEALILDWWRNANVQMATDGTLMRLSKEDFHLLCKEPLLRWVDVDEARQIVSTGGKWLDVRLPSEVEHFGVAGAINIPLYYLRTKISTLSREAVHVTCCDTGRRSSVAAYLLAQEGIQAYVLRDGLFARSELLAKP